jgi:hypothetical protein
MLAVHATCAGSSYAITSQIIGQTHHILQVQVRSLQRALTLQAGGRFCTAAAKVIIHAAQQWHALPPRADKHAAPAQCSQGPGTFTYQLAIRVTLWFLSEDSAQLPPLHAVQSHHVIHTPGPGANRHASHARPTVTTAPTITQLQPAQRLVHSIQS